MSVRWHTGTRSGFVTTRWTTFPRPRGERPTTSSQWGTVYVSKTHRPGNGDGLVWLWRAVQLVRTTCLHPFVINFWDGGSRITHKYHLCYDLKRYGGKTCSTVTFGIVAVQTYQVGSPAAESSEGAGRPVTWSLSKAQSSPVSTPC